MLIDVSLEEALEIVNDMLVSDHESQANQTIMFAVLRKLASTYPEIKSHMPELPPANLSEYTDQYIRNKCKY